MMQVIQSLLTGATEVLEVPCPQVKAGHLLVRTSRSLISAGTERMLVEFGKAGLLAKARQQPEKVREVLDKIRTDGLLTTIDAVKSKLDQPLALGYCNAGVVLETSTGLEGPAVGDRVVSNGPHAEVVCVPRNLCAKIPTGVSDEAAAFVVLAAVALQGIRLSQPALGEAFMVTGLGLVGQLTVRLLRAHGCRVIGADFDPGRLQLAREAGAEVVDLARGEDPVAMTRAFSRGHGVDAVLITASTKSSEPVHQAAQMCRKRGRIVLVGVAGLELSRDDFYEKELSFQVSCSYGPGRYDPLYEERGQDYPFGFVRWTEQRNFEAVLDMLADGRLDVTPLVSHRFPLQRANEAYELLAGGQDALGIILEYPSPPERPDTLLRSQTVQLAYAPSPAPRGPSPVVGVIGAGNYGTRVLIPALSRTGVRIKSITSGGGVSARHAAGKFAAEQATTDTTALLEDPEVDALVILTRHDSHARFACDALRAAKHVFVEKPLAISAEQLAEVEQAWTATRPEGQPGPQLMVGFNRRFAPQVQKIKGLLAGIREPKSLIMTVNAGDTPPEHWTQQTHIGGGRIIGEGCHFIDLLRFLVAAPTISVQARMMGAAAEVAVREDKMSFTLGFADGSFGTVHYLANGHRSFPKERLEVFCAGRVLQLDNFRRLRGYGWPGFSRMSQWRQDKGHTACITAFVEAVRHGQPAPIPFEELVEVTRVSFQVMEAAGVDRF